VLAINDRLAAILQHCGGGTLTWKCIGRLPAEMSTLDGEEVWGVVAGLRGPRFDGVGVWSSVVASRSSAD
jgi:hypothetical protein